MFNILKTADRKQQKATMFRCGSAFKSYTVRRRGMAHTRHIHIRWFALLHWPKNNKIKIVKRDRKKTSHSRERAIAATLLLLLFSHRRRRRRRHHHRHCSLTDWLTECDSCCQFSVNTRCRRQSDILLFYDDFFDCFFSLSCGCAFQLERGTAAKQKCKKNRYDHFYTTHSSHTPHTVDSANEFSV